MTEDSWIKDLKDLFPSLDFIPAYGVKNDNDYHCDDEEDDLPFEDACKESDECESCPYFDQCMEDELYSGPEFDVDDVLDTDTYHILPIDRIVFNDPATIVFWGDGTKTVVKTCDGDRFERYMGFAMACMKKMFGSTSAAKALMNSVAFDQPKKEPKKPAEKHE